MKRSLPLLMAGSFAAMVFSSGCFAQSTEVPTITGVTFNGSGCNTSNTTSVLSDDRTNLTVIFSNYVATAAPGVLDSSRSNCVISLSVNIPNNWQFATVAETVRGFTQVDGIATGSLQQSFFFTGLTQTVSSTVNFPNSSVAETEPGDYERSQTILAVFPQCTGVPNVFNANTQLAINNGLSTQQNVMTVDSIDFSIQEQYQLLWKKC